VLSSTFIFKHLLLIIWRSVSDIQVCKKCGKIEEISYYILCECVFTVIPRKAVTREPLPKPEDINSKEIKTYRVARKSYLFNKFKSDNRCLQRVVMAWMHRVHSTTIITIIWSKTRGNCIVPHYTGLKIYL